MTSASTPVEDPFAGTTPHGDARLGRRLFAYVWVEKRLLLAALVLYPLDALSVVVPPYLVSQILDVAIPNRDFALLNVLAAFYFGALVLEYLSGFASQFAMSVLGQRAMKRLRRDAFAHTLRLDAAYYDRHPIGRLLTRLTNDVEALNEVFATGAVTVVADIVTIVAVVVMMLVLDVRLTLFAFLVVPPLVAMALVYQRFSRRAFRSIRVHLARMNTFLAEHLDGMAVVQVFRQQQRTEREFHELNLAYRNANRSAILLDASLYSIVEAIGSCAVAAIIYYGATDLSAGVVGAGTLVAFIQYIRRFFVPVRDLSTKYTVWQSAFAAAERIFHLLDEPVRLQAAEDPAPKRRVEQGLALRDVWFAYREDPDPRDWILRNVNLEVRRGERVALVGATGSGKTTVLRLLNRFYDVQRGAVTIDGVDVRQMHLRDLRRLFAVVLQDVFLFSGSVMDNLTFAAGVSEEGVRHAARVVQAEAFLHKLPQGYDTPVQASGINFSSGERQLLAFARALAMDPEVLVLDEATSSVDSETEARIQHALDVLLEDRTAIIVAHRLSTIRKVDRIIVLDAGQVRESGTHDELMRISGGSYRNLVLQSSR